MRNPASELLRIPLPRTPLNKGKKGAGPAKSLRAWGHPILATIRGVESLILKIVVTPALMCWTHGPIQR
jgi:hypothetical protein